MRGDEVILVWLKNDDVLAKVQIDLYCERTLGHKYIGRVSIPVKKLFLDKKIKEASFSSAKPRASGSRWEIIAGDVVLDVVSNVVQGTMSAVILGPDSKWQPIPLTEVITSTVVKKAYRKATLSVHPDKLQ
ncbi:hypothetical protein RJ641_024383 [Dillenia turbinata]|uniref:Uncharacterized protein n=1 Tax=Dillenia turbinata TaxID=194707 RepID=A0AAN8UBE9_9MAGN